MPENTIIINIVPFEPKWVDSTETAYCVRITLPDGAMPKKEWQEQSTWFEIGDNKWCAGDYESRKEAESALWDLIKNIGIDTVESVEAH